MTDHLPQGAGTAPADRGGLVSSSGVGNGTDEAGVLPVVDQAAAVLPGGDLVALVWRVTEAGKEWPAAIETALLALRHREIMVRDNRHILDERKLSPIETDWLRHSLLGVELACSTAAETLRGFLPAVPGDKKMGPFGDTIIILASYLIGAEMLLAFMSKLCRPGKGVS